MNCRYCKTIHQYDSEYRVRQAVHAIDSSHPRCDLHWRFECAVCGNARHFHGTGFCPVEERLYCLSCSPEHRAPRESFWGWSYYYLLRCPWDEEWHPALDYLEHRGEHPWQIRKGWLHSKKGMVQSEELAPRWDLRTVPPDQITDEELVRGWDGVAEWWGSRYNPRGDINREWVIDPVLLDFLGKVDGLRILDAGCGTGYLARILAERGAQVVGVDISPALLAIGVGEEERDPLGIAYHRADLADLSFLGDRTFDAVVSNVVLQDVRRYREAIDELYRVIRGGGRFVFSITHPAFDRPPGRWLREPEDSERVEEWSHFEMDDYFGRSAVFWSPHGKPPAIGFHRPLRDYFEALHHAGFTVHRLEEPIPSEEALERHHREMTDFLKVPNFVILEARRPND